MQARSPHHGGVHRRMQAGLLGACIAGFCRGGARRHLMQRPNETTTQRSNNDTAQRGPTHQVQRGTQSSAAPLVRVNGQAIDPTVMSVVTCSEGFRQGSREN
jgi:hypothetical protein